MIPRFDRNASLAALASLLVPILLYLPTLEYSFVFDDRPLLIENPVVQSPQGIGEIFTTDLDPKARLQEAPTTNYLRPLFLAVAAGLYRLAGDQPFGWHLAAIMLHGLLGLLAFRVLRGEGFGIGAALFASLLFSLHPAHVQSAAWVSGIQDLLFALLALVAYLAYRHSGRQERPRAAALLALGWAYAVALLAKEPAVGLLIFVLAEAGFAELAVRRGAGNPARRRPWAELGLLAALTGAYFGYRAAVLGTLAHPFPTAPAWPEALASVPVAVLAYLRDLLFPFDLFLLHPARPVDSWLAPRAHFSFLLLAAVAALAWWGVSRRPALRRPLLFFMAWLAPVLALWAVNPEWMVMDRYLLLPSLALGWLLAELATGAGWPQGLLSVRTVAAAVLIGVFAAFSWQAMRDFRDEDSFWNAAVEADPGSSTAWTEWAKRRAEAGDPAAAETALEKAVALDPQAQLPRLRRALLALRAGRAAAAAAELETLVERNPGYLPAWRNLPVAYSQAGDGAGAWRALERGLALFPGDPLLWTHRAVVLRGQGRREEALAAIRKAIALDPGGAALVLREALLLAELGRPEDAAAAARRGLELRPGPALRGQLEALAGH